MCRLAFVIDCQLRGIAHAARLACQAGVPLAQVQLWLRTRRTITPPLANT